MVEELNIDFGPASLAELGYKLNAVIRVLNAQARPEGSHAQTREAPTADKLPDEPHASQQASPTKSELLERHWLEFLKWVQQWNLSEDKRNAPPEGDIASSPRGYKTPNEGDFWRWYIDNKLSEDTK